jgi:hypothetical protein
MNEFEIVNVINRPLAEVFAYASAVENVPMYSPTVTEAHQTSPGPVGIGSTGIMTGHFLGRHFESTFETTDYKLNEHFAAKTVSGPFHLEITHNFDATPEGGTRIVSHYRGESRGFFKLAEPIMFRVTKKQFEASADTMRELLEAETG